ncbi:MAG: ethanolamine ammonia-lyase reactivating factor EutA [Desulfobacterales bacterium]|nr:ethanolamine ammonia-lyase reactivating factor EutA [Desulfobacterales bacterium]
MRETILSVGIDIGTSTTQLVFSEIRIENMASMVSVPRLRIMDKRVVHESEIYYTPLMSASRIDGKGVRELVETEYAKAGVSPSRVGTGAVIITGETARKSNAAQVLETLSGLAGEFVVATAGPSLEGIIAGKGANAHAESKKRGAVVANLDIGGGTTNIAVFHNGEVRDTACLDIGGRLVKFSDNRGTVAYASDKIRHLAASIGISLEQGRVLAPEEIQTLTSAMADILVQALGLVPAGPDLDAMTTDKGLTLDYPIDYLTFSGGVADCIRRADRDLFAFGDLGPFLGGAIADSLIVKEIPVLDAKETIRATVVGAGSHTTDISGSTITFTDEALPLQNVPVLKLSPEDETAGLEKWAAIIDRKVAWFDLQGENQMPALAFKGPAAPGFDDIQILAESIITGMDRVMHLPAPLTVVVENDLAKALGQSLRARLGQKKQVICIDTIKVENGDYIDIGKGLANGRVVPVIVKTLVFGY